MTADSGKVRTDRDLLQNPNWERFDVIGHNYRMNQMAAAVALAQVERTDEFISLERCMASDYTLALKNSSLLTPQYVPDNYFYTYYTYSAKFNGDEYGISWESFEINILKMEVTVFMRQLNYYQNLHLKTIR